MALFRDHNPRFRKLNVAFLRHRLHQLGFKQWWVADQIRVDRKTLTRWLTGQVQQIQSDNLERLANCLHCEAADLISREGDIVATRAERLKAARLIEREALLETLGPIGEWRMLETLIRATMQPELPLSTLGQLYNQLSIAAWRQSHLTRAEPYAAKALEIGRRCRSRAVIAAANLNQGTLAAFRGRLKEALSSYKKCIRLSLSLGDEVTRAKAMSNCGAVYLDAGKWKDAIRWQQRAISSFARLGKSTNECIAWIGLADALLTGGRLKAAWDAATHAHALTGRPNYRRGRCDVSLLRAEILVKRSRLHAAAVELSRARAGFEVLEIRESRVETTAALIARLQGNLDEATRFLDRAWRLAREFPLERKRIVSERAALALVKSQRKQLARRRQNLST
jgi:tetratricopeptide (TPR) repeat protein